MGRIEEYLKEYAEGENNAIHAADLAVALGFSDLRTLRTGVHDERVQGAQICSDVNGYYFPQNEVERRAFLLGMKRRAFSAFGNIKGIRQAMRTDNMQLSFFENDTAGNE